jgi:GNAT superfamily N-acetyltransferase
VIAAQRGATIGSVPPLITTRRATLEDIDAMLGHVQAGLDTYVEFAPTGWQPPHAGAMRKPTLELLGDPKTWALLAMSNGRSVGHVSFYPGRKRSAERSDHPLSRPLIPGVAHFWQLFVVPDWWGRGVASLLHDHAVAEMRSRCFEQARLFTPSLHDRARRFYEHRGWSVVSEEWHDGFQLMMCEYRIALQ